jgi:hypothetical protein
LGVAFFTLSDLVAIYQLINAVKFQIDF